MNLRTLRAAALAASLSLVIVACGQKPGVHVSGADGGVASGQTGDQTGGGTTGGTTGGSTDVGGTSGGATGSGSDTTGGTSGGTTDTGGGTGGSTGGTTGGTGGGSSGGSTGGGSTGGTSGGSTGGSSGGSGGSSGGSSGGGQQQVTGSDRTGAGEETITLGIHAPVTGAAPLPAKSFQEANDYYWQYKTKTQGETVLGRSEVEVEFRDDKYDPGSARQVCRELAASSFLVVGGGGTDQIQACGQFAGVAKFPYFSAGVTENGLEGNQWYFASSMTYRQQGILLAQYLSKNFSGQKTAMVVTDTPNFDDAVTGWENGVSQYGINYYKTIRHPKGDTSWYSAVANDLKTNGVEVVYILSSPVDYIRFAQKANELGYAPQYVGVGITKGLNAVLGSGCDDVNGGIFFSPFPGLDYARQNFPAFFEAAGQYGGPQDDLALALWGIWEQTDKLFEAYEATYGNDLTREDFRALVDTAQVSKGVFPSVAYSPDNHFGGQAVHVLQADCAKGEHVTLATYASAF